MSQSVDDEPTTKADCRKIIIKETWNLFDSYKGVSDDVIKSDFQTKFKPQYDRYIQNYLNVYLRANYPPAKALRYSQTIVLKNIISGVRHKSEKGGRPKKQPLPSSSNPTLPSNPPKKQRLSFSNNPTFLSSDYPTFPSSNYPTFLSSNYPTFPSSNHPTISTISIIKSY